MRRAGSHLRRQSGSGRLPFATAPDGSEPLRPDSVSGRLGYPLCVKVNLCSPRHCATVMLTNGVDLRTTVGRLSHGDGGGAAPCACVYTHSFPLRGLRAAQVLARSLPGPQSDKNQRGFTNTPVSRRVFRFGVGQSRVVLIYCWVMDSLL